MFPKWTNRLRGLVLALALAAPVYAGILIYFGFSPQATDVGYQPQQPIPYSHLLHVGQLGIDCLYCHTTVDKAAAAAIPPTQTCINCHSQATGILKDSPKLTLLNEAYYGGGDPQKAGMPIPWVRVHDLPDYAYFNHSAHVNRGIGCVSCHGRVDRMDVVYQAEPLSMAWCLDCHRDPRPHLRPLSEITNMEWQQPSPEVGQRLYDEYNIRDADYLQSCSVCHR